MARSPLTLAAVVASVLPQSDVVDVSTLTEHASGRFDTAAATLSDGRRVVVQVAAHADADAELSAQLQALAALTPGVRAQLPFRAPSVLGAGSLQGRRAAVFDFLPGYRVDAAEVPPGPGAAVSLGAAIAAVHALPDSVVRARHLPERTTDHVRAQVARLLDRVSASSRVPVSLLARWSRAAAADRLWRFECTVSLGGAAAEAFMLEDRAGVPAVTGLIGWRGLCVDDPAVDLAWLSSAPQAAPDVFRAYGDGSARTPDAALRTRARLYAELEFARWLVHGHDADRDDIVDDAVAMLESLAAGVIGDDLLADEDADVDVDVDETIARLGEVPQGAARWAATAMQTDAFSLEDSMVFTGEASVVLDPAQPQEREPVADDPGRTEPLVVSDWVGMAGTDPAAEADRASQQALRHWGSSQ